MLVTALPEDVQNYLEMADEKNLLAIYSAIGSESERTETIYTDELKDKLDRRYLGYKNGKTELVSSAESKDRIKNLFNK